MYYLTDHTFENKGGIDNIHPLNVALYLPTFIEFMLQ